MTTSLEHIRNLMIYNCTSFALSLKCEIINWLQSKFVTVESRRKWTLMVFFQHFFIAPLLIVVPSDCLIVFINLGNFLTPLLKKLISEDKNIKGIFQYIIWFLILDSSLVSYNIAMWCIFFPIFKRVNPLWRRLVLVNSFNSCFFKFLAYLSKNWHISFQ